VKKPIRTILGISFNVLITAFLVLSLLGFVPSLSEYNRNTLIIITAGSWMVQVLEFVSKMDVKKDKDKN